MRLVSLLLILGSLGCWQTPPLAISRAGCDLYTNAAEPFSAALPEACATFRDRLEVELDAARPDARPIAMSVWAERQDVQIDCPARASACAIPLHTSSVIPLDLHELVHAHLGTIGTSNALFAEGIAVVYGCDGRDIEPIEPTPLEAWLTNDEAFYAVPAGESYWPAASFVAYLIERFGAPRFFAFYRVARTDRLEVLDQRAIDVLGVSIHDLVEAWSSLGPVTSAEVCRPILACDAPALTSPEITLARGVTRSPSRLRAGAIRTFEVVGDARTTVRLWGPAPSFEVFDCDGRPGVRGGASPENRVETSLELPRGRYAIWVEASLPGDVAEVTASLRVE